MPTLCLWKAYKVAGVQSEMSSEPSGAEEDAFLMKEDFCPTLVSSVYYGYAQFQWPDSHNLK